MAEVRNFDEEFADYKDREGPTFVLGGQEFHAKGVVSVSAFMDKDNESNINASVRFLRLALLPEDREKFDELVEDPDVLISMYQIDEVVNWIIAQVSGRPTEARAPSGGGGARTARTLKAASNSPAATGS